MPDVFFHVVLLLSPVLLKASTWNNTRLQPLYRIRRTKAVQQWFLKAFKSHCLLCFRLVLTCIFWLFEAAIALSPCSTFILKHRNTETLWIFSLSQLVEITKPWLIVSIQALHSRDTRLIVVTPSIH